MNTAQDIINSIGEQDSLYTTSDKLHTTNKPILTLSYYPILNKLTQICYLRSLGIVENNKVIMQELGKYKQKRGLSSENE